MSPLQSNQRTVAARRVGVRVWRVAVIAHRSLMLVVALHAFLVLASGGHEVTAVGVRVHATAVGRPIILLLVLMLAGYPLRRQRLSLDAFAPHAGTALFASLALVYLANGSYQYSGDTFPAVYLPISIVRDGDFYLDEFPDLYHRDAPYYLQVVGDRYVSRYPVAPALLALPVFLPYALFGGEVDFRVLLQLGKLASAFMVALSAAVLFGALTRLVTRRLAVVLTLVYGLGTSSFSTSSQALWQHGPSQLALALAFYCLVRGQQEGTWVGLAGLPLALAVLCRPSDVMIAVPLGGYVILQHRRSFCAFVLSGLPPTLFHFWYNQAYFGDPFRTQFSLLGGPEWGTPPLEGLAGLLLSPARGLLVYSPVFALSFAGAIVAWRRRGDPLLRAAGVGVLLTVASYSRWNVWWGGHSYGPRLLADLAPSLALLLSPLAAWMVRSWFRRVFTVLAVWSVLAHGVGAFYDDGRWNAHPDIDRTTSRLWLWTDNPLSNAVLDATGRTASMLGFLPTSATDPALVTASCAIEPSLGDRFSPAVTVPLRVRVANTGNALWRSRGRRGNIVLWWQWIADDGQAALLRPWVPLKHDLFPGRVYIFDVDMRVPDRPGSYRLDVGLASEARGQLTAVPGSDCQPRRAIVGVGVSRTLDGQVTAFLPE